MTKAVLIKACASCGTEFRKAWRHQTYCTLVCAIFPRIQKGGPDECWPWPGAANDHGYGQVSWNKERIYVHRFVCEAFNCRFNTGLDVMHTCDNPPCCNPRHLRLGTTRDNVLDMVAKGRQVHNPRRGSKHGGAKLTDDQVRAIRKAIHNGGSTRAIAKEYGMSQPAIAAIRTGRTWDHLL